MIAWIKQLFGGSGTSRLLSTEVTPDHVELSDTHLVVGLKIDWLNRTAVPISVKEIRMMLHLRGREEPLRFYPLERFAHVPGERAMQKKPLRAFTLPPGEINTQQMRFISQEVRDIEPGNYLMDIQLKDMNDAIYKDRKKIHLDGKIKYRHSEAWQED